ncbi:hypothetical protein V3C99_009580 [Haemonchus contortus]
MSADETDGEAPRSVKSTTGATRTGTSATTGRTKGGTTTTGLTTQGDEGDEEKSVKVLVAKIRNSDGSLETIRLSSNLAHELVTGMCAMFMFGLFLIVAIVEIVVGSLNVENCPVNRMIPIWLIVSGGISCLRYVLAIGLAIMHKSGGSVGSLRAMLECLFSIFWVVWLIFGTFWVYSVAGVVTFEQHDSDLYCNHLTFVLAFILITVTYVMIFTWICCCCCFICCVAPFIAAQNISRRSTEKVVG